MRNSLKNIFLSSTLSLAALSVASHAAMADECFWDQLESKELTVYSSRSKDLLEPVLEEFTETTGVKVNLLTGKSEELIERVKKEGKKTKADVLILKDVSNLYAAYENKLVQQPGTACMTKKEIEAESLYHFFPTSFRARVAIYNKDNVKPEEVANLTYLDLASETWKGRVCMRSSENIYNRSLVAGLVRTYGEEAVKGWIDGLVANFARHPHGNDRAQISAVLSGECDITLANTYYLSHMLKDDAVKDKIGVAFPDQEGAGAHVNVSAAAVTAHAKNMPEAEALVHFLGHEAQEFFANENFEYPVDLKNVPINPLIKGLAEGDDKYQVSKYTIDGKINVKMNFDGLEHIGKYYKKATELLNKSDWQ